MGRIDPETVYLSTNTVYPAPYDKMVAGRSSLRLSDAGGLTQFGVNITILEPGAMSSMRHWHVHEEEFVMVLEGNVTLVQDEGEFPMGPGDCAAFKAGDENGHHFVNKSDTEVRLLVVGSRLNEETAYYSDHDVMVTTKGREFAFTRKDGSPLPQGEE